MAKVFNPDALQWQDDSMNAVPQGYYQGLDGLAWGGASGTAPIAAGKAWMDKNDLTTAADLQSRFSPRTLQALQGTDVSPELWYSMGNTAGDYDPAEVSRLVKMYDEIGAKNSGGWGDVMGNALSSPAFQMFALPFAASGIGSLLGNGAGAGGGFVDAIGSGVGAGSPITGALGTAGATAGGSGMDWIDVLGDWPSYSDSEFIDSLGNFTNPNYEGFIDSIGSGVGSGSSITGELGTAAATGGGIDFEKMAAELFDKAGTPGFDQYGNPASGWDWIKSYLPSGVDMSSVKDAASLAKMLGLDGKTIGSLLSSGLGAYASNKQTTALEDQAKRYEGYGAPYRQKLSDLYANPDSFLTSKEVQTPVQQGTNTLMRSLSTQGNPFGSGNALQQGQSYASDQLFGKLGQEKDRLAGFGGLSSYNQAAPQAATNAIQSTSNGYNAIGSGLGNIFNPPQTASQTMAEFLKTMRGP